VLRTLVREWRTRAGLSQRELSARLSRPHNFIVKVEGGTRGLQIVEALDIARACGQDPLRFFQEFCERL